MEVLLPSTLADTSRVPGLVLLVSVPGSVPKSADASLVAESVPVLVPVSELGPPLLCGPACLSAPSPPEVFISSPMALG